MKRYVRRLAVTTAAITAALALSSSSAFAFFCYNASRSDQGNTQAGTNSQALFIINEDALVAFCGLTPEEATAVLDQMEALGYPRSPVINERAVMAGGLERNGKNEHLLDDGKGIDHLDPEAYFTDLFTLAPSCAEE